MGKKVVRAPPRPKSTMKQPSGKRKVEQQDSDDSDGELQMYTDNKVESDEEEVEVFDLGGSDDDEDDDKDDHDDDDDNDDDDDDSDEGDDDDESDDGGDDDDEEDDDEDDDDENGLKRLVDKIAPSLRQKVIMAGAGGDDSEEEEDDDDEGESWGKKKAYWSGDTADLEIGQDVQDALDEEEAAKELHNQKMSRMKESDYFEDFGEGQGAGSDEDESEEEEVDVKAKKGKGKDKLMNELELLALGNEGTHASIQVEKLSRDVSKLTREQKLKLVEAESPELLGLVSELRERVDELRSKITPIRQLVDKAVSSKMDVDDDIVDYLEVKQQLLLSYCINVVFYLYMKAQGQSVRSHPVMRQLLELRYAMEKMRPLDGKLKHQVDRLIKLATTNPNDQEALTAALRPNPLALVAREGTGKKSKSKMDDDDEDDEEEEDSEGEGDEGSDDDNKDVGIYKAPKIAAAPYQENEKEADKREAQLLRKKKKLSNSEIMETLLEEFGSAPEASSSSGISKMNPEQRRLQEEADERREFEEERFTRLTLSRKDKKAIKRRSAEATRLDNFNDIGDIGEFEEFAELAQGSSSGDGDVPVAAASKSSSRKAALATSDDTAKALQKALSAFAQSGEKEKSKKKSAKSDGDDLLEEDRKKSRPSLAAMADDSDDDDDGDAVQKVLADDSRKRRRAPDFSMDDDDDGDFGFGGSGRGRGRRGDDQDDDDDGEDDGEEDLLEKFAKKKREFLAKKEEHYAPVKRYGGIEDVLPESGKRAATYEIIKNRGLTPHRKKENRNPRVKKRNAYEKALVRRKGAVREVVAGAAANYDGERTGIKAHISRSRKIGN